VKNVVLKVKFEGHENDHNDYSRQEIMNSRQHIKAIINGSFSFQVGRVK